MHAGTGCNASSYRAGLRMGALGKRGWGGVRPARAHLLARIVSFCQGFAPDRLPAAGRRTPLVKTSAGPRECVQEYSVKHHEPRHSSTWVLRHDAGHSEGTASESRGLARSQNILSGTRVTQGLGSPEWIMNRLCQHPGIKSGI
ncbi:hypothetical protein F751_3369 [Auxenochlorella protothecoides]|uniref:Uncharacterized protein n=1 Tax=Auxenochlorella protothecoides TaxID=3075 RepID=A0A087SBS4_AUXPR|nr:hypothetical protein F751_3369 [Auxenochlorella protothecoides]KFM23178.1 hypothetical protein F751_3369 [Auxenochlorella protothecoides]